MKREHFDHVVCAVAAVVEDDVVVIGSQAILGQFPDAPQSLLTSLEVDVYPLNDPSKADQIDGALGDGSPFHALYGYYAHGVGPETAEAPAGWEDRRVPVELATLQGKRSPVTAWCMEAHDLVLAKLAAGRPHDREYSAQALAAGLVNPQQLRRGVELIPTSHRKRVGQRLEGLLTELESARE